MRKVVALLALSAALAPAAAAEPDLACPAGTTLRQRGADSWCQTPLGVSEGPFWGRFADGSLRYHGTARRGETDGTWTQWYPNGVKAKEAGYADGELRGPFRVWDEGGQLIFAGTHDVRGEMDGTWTRWWSNGRKRVEWGMRHGVQHGPVAAWFQTGGRRMQGQRSDGAPDGDWIHWHEDGRVAHRCRYAAGRLVAGHCPEGEAP